MKARLYRAAYVVSLVALVVEASGAGRKWG
jgi:hypothetical protein